MEWLKINQEGIVEFASEEIKLVPEVQALLALKYNKQKGDLDGRKRYRALAELKYVYLAYSSKSPYSDYSEQERLEEAKLDCELAADWIESDELKAVVLKYQKGSMSKIERLLRTAEKVIDKLDIHLNSVDLAEKKENGEYVNKPKEIIDTLKQLPALAQTLQNLEQQVKRGVVGTMTAKGDQEPGWMDGSENNMRSDDREDSDN
jgi:hypothetical protein